MHEVVTANRNNFALLDCGARLRCVVRPHDPEGIARFLTGFRAEAFLWLAPHHVAPRFDFFLAPILCLPVKLYLDECGVILRGACRQCSGAKTSIAGFACSKRCAFANTGVHLKTKVHALWFDVTKYAGSGAGEEEANDYNAHNE